MFFRILGLGVLTAALYWVAKYVLWPDVKFIIYLNREEFCNRREPEKLERTYRFLMAKLLAMAIILYIILIFLRRLGIGQ